MGLHRLLWGSMRLISKMNSSAPRVALRSVGCWDDRSSIMIISALILQVLGSTSLILEPKMVSQCGFGVSFWGQWEKNLAPTNSQCGLKTARSCRMCELGHNGSFLNIPHHLMMVPHGLLYQAHSQPFILTGRACCTVSQTHCFILFLNLSCDKQYRWVSYKLCAMTLIQSHLCIVACCMRRVPWATASRLGALQSDQGNYHYG